MKLYSLKETIDNAVDVFHLDDDGFPEIIPLGLPKIDEELGGLGPGSCGILAAATGVGKSSTMLRAILDSDKVRVGVISVEDPPDVLGCRVLAAFSGIDSLRIRRKRDLTERELAHLRAVHNGEVVTPLNHLFAFPIGGELSEILKAVRVLAAEGCKLIWLDYLQKVKGHNADRRAEVGATFTKFQAECAKHGVAGMAISQIRRVPKEEPISIFHLKETGDLENEARIILLAYRVPAEEEKFGVDPKKQKQLIEIFLAKSTYGGEGIQFHFDRDQSGTLFYKDVLKNDGEDW